MINVMETDVTTNWLEQDQGLAYQSNLEHLLDEFRRLDLQLHLYRLNQQPQPWADSLTSPSQQAVAKADVDSILGHDSFAEATLGDPEVGPQNQPLLEQLHRLDAHIQQRVVASLDQGVWLALPALSQLFQLNALEAQCLIMCLAPELGRQYHGVFAMFQDDATQRQPSVDLVLSVLCPTLTDRLAARSLLTPASPLIYYRLVHLTHRSAEPQVPWGCQSLKLDDRIVDALIGSKQIDAHLSQVCQLHPCADEPDPATLSPEQKVRLGRFLRKHFRDADSRPPLVFYLHGRYGSGRQAIANWICRQLGFALLTVNVNKLLEAPLPFSEMMRLVGRETVLQPAALCLENVDRLLGADDSAASQLQTLCDEIEMFSSLTFLLGHQPWTPQSLFRHSRFIAIACPTPDEETRKTLWTHHLQAHANDLTDDQVAELASKFQLTSGQMEDAIRDAVNLASWRAPQVPPLTMDDLQTASQHQSSQALDGLAQKIEPHYGWTDIVLPDDQMHQLREIVHHVTYKHKVMGEWGFGNQFSLGEGVAALFAGPSGTGKTMAADVLAHELALALYKVDLSGVVSKYIGETEKNLNRIFDAARNSNAILFFDEADALFGTRSEVKDAHDRYANIETAYLLQKMEEYSGIVILTTNLQQNMDDAFLRRIRFVINFPFPDEVHREKIWRHIFPAQTPVSAAIDFSELASKIKLSGGSIKNISLRAAYMAAEQHGEIQLEHVIAAAKYELKKKGSSYIDIDIDMKVG